MSSNDIHIDVHHVTRVEGHGNILVDIDKGEVKTVRWSVPEAPRFFEAMVVGRDCTELQPITSRICGICSIGHSFASLKATEAAMRITISEQTHRLRRILNHGENLQSHVLHVGYLALPDLLKVGSVIPLATTHKDAVLLVVKLHRLANETCDIVGGRTTHPIRTCIGGFTKVPPKKNLQRSRPVSRQRFRISRPLLVLSNQLPAACRTLCGKRNTCRSPIRRNMPCTTE